MTTSDLHKAAVLLRCLPEKQASQILGLLPREKIAAVSEAMADVSRAEIDASAGVIREFSAALRGLSHENRPEPPAAYGPSGAFVGYARHRPAAPPFQFLHDAEATELVALLADEHPQIIAIVLAHLPSHRAAAVLAEMAPEQQSSVVRRITLMQEPDDEILREVARALQLRLQGRIHSMPRGLAFVVKVLNAMNPADERMLLGEIAQADPELSSDIRRAMFGADVAACSEWPAMKTAC